MKTLLNYFWSAICVALISGGLVGSASAAGSAPPSGGTDYSSLIWMFVMMLVVTILGSLFIQWLQRRQMNGGGGGPGGGFTKSKAKKFEPESGPRVTFADVAGVETAKRDCSELVEFLKDGKLLKQLGGKAPKAALLVGPPGTGKTLIARAVAGEANVPFYSLSGSDFVEMFVGVGAARVRDLFETVAKGGGGIIFIDEIDAVGRHRGTGIGGGNDEREQTLNQLLVEIDGFKSDANILLLAATNRPDVLDPALLRPGRFGKQILVTGPDVAGRKDILAVHMRNKPAAKDVNLQLVAEQTPGFVGADLAEVTNNATIRAWRRIKAEADRVMKEEGISEDEARKRAVLEITQEDLILSIDDTILGSADEGRGKRMSEEDKEHVTVHEVGHGWMVEKLNEAGLTDDIVQKVTIVPRARAAGYMMSMPAHESMEKKRLYLLSKILVCMGGRAAQFVFFGERGIGTGASNDFEQAWNIAHDMVTKFGMSRLGILSVSSSGSSPFLGKSLATNCDYSHELHFEIESEVRRILNESYAEAVRVISRDKALFEAPIKALRKTETLTRPEWLAAIGKASEENTSPAT